ncbi:universal stress protein [Brevibacterium aurantiacum]|uniref:universal stress protein n=1 Tax=Brevibacterium aurantiacum TaxID=273384 RepID=UPI000F64A1B4|nr:universal stress protein [Brevibacterium aurantiacum]AZL08119.1 universal stress protein [Brevibacterium aurantiacum]
MTILIGYLPAPEGEAALRAGFAEAKLRSSNAVVINSQRRGASGTPTEIDRIVSLGKDSDVEVEVLQPDHEDDLPGTLNELVEEHDAQLIVIGLRKRSAIGKFILGSQAQRILLEAEVPVLTAKA